MKVYNVVADVYDATGLFTVGRHVIASSVTAAKDAVCNLYKSQGGHVDVCIRSVSEVPMMDGMVLAGRFSV